MSTLVAYFSRAGENYLGGSLQKLSVGNTEVAARLLAETIPANLFKLEPLIAYSSDYNTCIEEAQQDKKRSALPALKCYPSDMAKYDTLYLGYPNYWGTMPMAVFTFLERYALTGVTIRPFCTHEGSGMGTSEADIQHLCPGATVEKGLAILGSQVKNAGPKLTAWATNLGDMP